MDSGQERAAASEALFRRAFTEGLPSIPRNERSGGLNSVSGHVAESVAAMLLVDLGWTPVDQMIGPFSAGHGIDLAFLTSTMDRVVVVEVKGTLRPTGWPRLSRSTLEQFSPEWLDKPDNPGMANLELTSRDVSGLVLMIQFARREWKCAVTNDFRTGTPVHDLAEVEDLVSRAG
jgi:hypothetical protein